PRRADREAARARDPRHQPARRPDRRPRHHPVSRRSDAARGRTAAAHPEDRDPLLDRRQEDPARRRRAVHGAQDSGGARCADRFRPAEGDSARRARRPRSPRAADSGRLRRQERADLAEKRRSADTLNIAVAVPSVVKGETLADTARNIEAMAPDMIVIRHASSGAPHLLSRICRSRIINAGDGMHEHPTQALLDAFTIREHKKKIDGLKVTIVGDLLHSRVLRSNVLLLTRLGAEVWVSGPPTLVPVGLERHGVHVSSSIDEAVADADVVMMLRIQQERMHGAFFPSLREYFFTFGMTKARVARAKPDVIIMHPGPMNSGVEIDSEVADDPYSVILEPVPNAAAVRMASL